MLKKTLEDKIYETAFDKLKDIQDQNIPIEQKLILDSVDRAVKFWGEKFQVQHFRRKILNKMLGK